jgi:hypothetical protein
MILALLACAAAPASAQYDRPQECWNPRVGHYEQVRPGERQNDLDFRRCRIANDYRESDRYNRGNDRYYGADRDISRECWNPRARNFEAVRPNERQDDLDFSRCRPLSERMYGRSDAAQECWNPRAGHFENVREGTRQDDLDFSRCRWR